MSEEILAAHELLTLQTMAVYWLEVVERDNQVERERLAAGELEQAVHVIGAEKVLKIIAEYVEKQS